MFLLTALVAVWLSCFQLHKKIVWTEQQIASMRSVARELIIDDPTKIAVVRKLEEWSSDNRWEVYLPDGEYAMRLATRKIDPKGFSPVSGETRVRSGKHLVELQQSKGADKHTISILLDGQAAIEVEESRGWNPRLGATGYVLLAECVQLPPGKPLVLRRQRFRSASGTPNAPCAGLLLWIERLVEAKSKNIKKDDDKN